MVLFLLLFSLPVNAGYDCDHLNDLNERIEKHGAQFEALRREIDESELQAEIDKRYADCKAEIAKEADRKLQKEEDNDESDE